MSKTQVHIMDTVMKIPLVRKLMLEENRHNPKMFLKVLKSPIRQNLEQCKPHIDRKPPTQATKNYRCNVLF